MRIHASKFSLCKEYTLPYHLYWWQQTPTRCSTLLTSSQRQGSSVHWTLSTGLSPLDSGLWTQSTGLLTPDVVGRLFSLKMCLDIFGKMMRATIFRRSCEKVFFYWIFQYLYRSWYPYNYTCSIYVYEISYILAQYWQKHLHYMYTTHSKTHNFTDKYIPEYTYSTYKHVIYIHAWTYYYLH